MDVIWKCRVTTKENGTFDLQIEDWSKGNQSACPYGNVLVAYPESKANLNGTFSPKRGEKFRCAFDFPNHELALDAAETIAFREGELSWFTKYLDRKDYLPCLTGNYKN